MKEAFKKYFPNNFFDLPKKGFEIPVGDWLRSKLKKELLSYSNKQSIKEQDIFEYQQISLLINEHLNQKKDHTFKLWTFYCFQKWYYNTYVFL